MHLKKSHSAELKLHRDQPDFKWFLAFIFVDLTTVLRYIFNLFQNILLLT